MYEHLIARRSHGDGQIDAHTFDISSISSLNELTQKNKQQIEFLFEEYGGNAHRKVYECNLRIDGKTVSIAEGVSKKVAKAKAATLALRTVNNEKNETEKAKQQNLSSFSSFTSLETQTSYLSEGRRALAVLGVDIDSILITRASAKPVVLQEGDNLEFHCANVMEKNFNDLTKLFLERVHRPRSTSRRSFDLITLFSVTMWIHLNHGDDGLWTFLEMISDLTEHLIVEPQPRRCYRYVRSCSLWSMIFVFNCVSTPQKCLETVESYAIANSTDVSDSSST